jgi:hypothetical protein
MPNELDSLLALTALIIGIVSVGFYMLVIRHNLPSNGRGNAAATQNGAAANPTRNAASGAAASVATSPQTEQIPCSRVPPHVSLASAQLAVNGGSNLLIDGLVAFKHCKAASASTASAEMEAEIRKARAKLFSNLLEGSGVSAPPAKGSAIVVTITIESTACRYQRRVLYLLATYYNLLVILAVPAGNTTFSDQDRMDAIATLRGDGDNSNDDVEWTSFTLSVDTLPSHRVAVSSTVTGRVAFVRQLQRIELVLDYDPEVLALLTRFGHRVIVYGGGSDESAKPDAEIASKLGRVLL